MLEAVLVGRWDAKHREMADESRGHVIATAARWSTRRANRNVLQLLPEELLAVVDSSEILKLAQQLDGRLGTVRIQLGHV